MILAAILFLYAFSWTPTLPPLSVQGLAQSADQASSSQQKPDASVTQQNPVPAQDQTPASPKSTPSSPVAQPQPHSPAAKKPAGQRKKTASKGDCVSPTPQTGAAQPGAAQNPQSPAPHDAASSAPANCPPAKVVVRHGGTSEPSVRISGNPSRAQATYDRSSTEQLLSATEQNLKRTTGHTLSSDQQEMVNQINQFIKQSRAAVAAGDTGRGRILARKARLLSDELVAQ